MHTPTDIRKWGINVYDLNAGTSRSVFGIANNRKIQSVACSSTGNEQDDLHVTLNRQGKVAS